MFTFEIMVNGSLVGRVYVYGPSEGEVGNGYCRYRYEYYRSGSWSNPAVGNLTNGHIDHKRSDGVETLVCSILTDVTKMEREEGNKTE